MIQLIEFSKVVDRSRSGGPEDPGVEAGMPM